MTHIRTHAYIQARHIATHNIHTLAGKLSLLPMSSLVTLLAAVANTSTVDMRASPSVALLETFDENDHNTIKGCHTDTCAVSE